MNTEAKPKVQGNQSAEKAFRILEFLVRQPEPTRLMDIANAVDMNNSTTLRFLTTMVSMGYVAQESDTSRYYLTYKIVSLGRNVSENKQISRTVSPYLKKISDTLQETVCLAIEQNSQVVYIDMKEGPRQIIKVMQRIGSIAPMHCTGIGKLLLLNYTEPQIDEYIRQKGLRQFTQYTLVTREALMHELNEVRKQGYALDNEECEIGARCIAFPIYDSTDKIIAGISVTGPSSRITQKFADRWIPFLRQTTQEISKQFGANGQS